MVIHRLLISLHFLSTGVQVFIPLFPMHRDRRFYEEPNKFDPERFMGENQIDKNQMDQPFMPFGDGPRICIGIKLARLQTKLALFTMLKNFRFELSDEMKAYDLKYDPKSFMPFPSKEIQLHVFKR